MRLIVNYYPKNLILGNIFNCSIIEKRIWKWFIKTNIKEMELIRIKNHVVFIKPFWCYCKDMSESTGHNIKFFVWRIHSIVICKVAKCSSFNKKKNIITIIFKMASRAFGFLGTFWKFGLYKRIDKSINQFFKYFWEIRKHTNGAILLSVVSPFLKTWEISAYFTISGKFPLFKQPLKFS